MLIIKESANFGRKHYHMYSTNLTDSQWKSISKFFDLQRKRKYSLRNIIDGILYLLKSGAQWELLPREFPPFGITFYYFRKWKTDGIWQQIVLELAKAARKAIGKNATPYALILDSQTVKNSEWGVQDKGFDGNKRIQGRKRNVAIDSTGFLLSCVVSPANRHDSVAGKELIKRIASLELPGLGMLVADKAYGGLKEEVAREYGWELQVSPQLKEREFIPVAHRWKVERSISWMMWSRRLSKDYELHSASSEAWVMIHSLKNILKYF